jgi:hypothetical protein
MRQENVAVEPDESAGRARECRVCGAPVRTGDDRVEIEGASFHAGCVDAPASPRRRRPGPWAAMGSPGQMATGEVQRDPEV